MRQTLQELESDAMDFEEAFKKLMEHEGGYSNHPNDPGGETMYGITKRVARANGYIGDMRNLPLELAKKIAKTEYWNPVSADLLPTPIKFDMFDAAYNSGPMQALKWLQKALFVEADGVVGTQTLTALKASNPVSVLARFNGQRLNAMTDMRNWNSFSRGWSKRVAQNLMSTEG
jgi:lysozyme family protein